MSERKYSVKKLKELADDDLIYPKGGFKHYDASWKQITNHQNNKNEKK